MTNIVNLHKLDLQENINNQHHQSAQIILSMAQISHESVCPVDAGIRTTVTTSCKRK